MNECPLSLFPSLSCSTPDLPQTPSQIQPRLHMHPVAFTFTVHVSCKPNRRRASHHSARRRPPCPDWPNHIRRPTLCAACSPTHPCRARSHVRPLRDSVVVPSHTPAVPCRVSLEARQCGRQNSLIGTSALPIPWLPNARPAPPSCAAFPKTLLRTSRHGLSTPDLEVHNHRPVVRPFGLAEAVRQNRCVDNARVAEPAIGGPA